MAGGEVEIVARAIEIGGHRRDEIASMLTSIGLAELQSRNFGNGVPFIGGFKRPGQQCALFNRLRRELRINAGGTEK